MSLISNCKKNYRKVVLFYPLECENPIFSEDKEKSSCGILFSDIKYFLIFRYVLYISRKIWNLILKYGNHEHKIIHARSAIK